MHARSPRVRAGRWTATLVVVLAACTAPADPPTLGAVDGHDLPPADTGRVMAGDPAPDFALRALDGDVVRLSDYRGEKDVILVFYRGHW